MSPTASPSSPQHDAGLDVTRILATILVIQTHVNMSGTWTFSPNWNSANVINAIAHASVPLFMMVTGALLVPRLDDIKKLGTRMFRVALLFVSWSLITYFYFTLRGSKIPFTIAEIERYAFPLWYLKMLLAVYFFLPLLQVFYRGASRGWMLVACGVLFVLFSVFPTLDEINGLTLSAPYNFYIGQFNFGYFLYFIAGALCSTCPLPRWLAPVAGLGFIASTAATALGTMWLSRAQGAPAVAYLRYLSPTVVLQAVSCFLVVRLLSSRLMPVGWGPVVRNIAGLTLGIYAMHLIVLDFVQWRGLSMNSFWIWLSVPATTIVVFAIAASLTYLLRWAKPLRILVT